MSPFTWEDFPRKDEAGVIWLTPSVFVGDGYRPCFNCQSPTAMIDINFVVVEDDEGRYCGCELDLGDSEEYDEEDTF